MTRLFNDPAPKHSAGASAWEPPDREADHSHAMRVSDFFDRSSLSPVRKIFESLGRLDIAGPTDHAGEDAKALARLNAEVNAIVNTAEVKQQLVNLGVNPIGRGSLDELQAFVKAEVIRWGKVVQEAGLAGSE